MIAPLRTIAPEDDRGRTLFGLLEALGDAERLACDLIGDDGWPADDADLEKILVRATLADGREIAAVRVERRPATLTCTIVLLTEEDL